MEMYHNGEEIAEELGSKIGLLIAQTMQEYGIGKEFLTDILLMSTQSCVIKELLQLPPEQRKKALVERITLFQKDTLYVLQQVEDQLDTQKRTQTEEKKEGR